MYPKTPGQPFNLTTFGENASATRASIHSGIAQLRMVTLEMFFLTS